MSFLFPKAKKPPPPPTPATRAESTILTAGRDDNLSGFSSLISSGGQGSGLTRKAKTTGKKSLIGGA